MDQESSAHPGSFQAWGMALIELNKLKTLWYPLSVIAALRHSVGESALAIACQVDRRTANKWLVALTELGYLTRVRTYKGYILTPLAEAAIGEMLPIFAQKVYTFVQFLNKSAPTTTTDSLFINYLKDRESVVVVDPKSDQKVCTFVHFCPNFIKPPTLVNLQQVRSHRQK